VTRHRPLQRGGEGLFVMTSEFKNALLDNTTGGYCAYCGKYIAREEWHLDHIIPRSRGGSWKYNLIPACGRCNLRKGGYTPGEFKQWLTEKTYKTARAILPIVEEFCNFLSEEEADNIMTALGMLLDDISCAQVQFFVENFEEVSCGSWPNAEQLSKQKS
jgi:hypothetical protein